MTDRPTRPHPGSAAPRNGPRLAALLALGLGLAACVPSTPEPVSSTTPPPAPQPQATSAPPQQVSPTYDNWMDAPRTPGDWSFSLVATGALAQYGTDPANPLFGLECVKATRQVLLHVPRVNGGALLVRTESTDRTLEPANIAGGPAYARYALAARDPLLDAMAFSKGRFAAVISGGPTYYLPAWPEVTRVVEECRI